MHKLFTLLVALLMIATNAFAVVNVNTANKDELQMLTGIGPAKAQAIIDYRTKNGDFKTVDDLTKVPGIGPAVLGKMKNDVILTGSTTAKPATAATQAATKAEPAKIVPPAGAAAPASAPTAASKTPATAGAAAAAKPVTTTPAAAAGAPAPATAKPAATPAAAKVEPVKPAESKDAAKPATKKDATSDAKSTDAAAAKK